MNGEFLVQLIFPISVRVVILYGAFILMIKLNA